MPTYEYLCRSCGERLEAVQAFTDDPLVTCPACGGELRKVFGSVGIVFKGSGFYKTDSRSSTSASKTAANDGQSTAATPASSGGESAKPADAPASTPASTPAAASTAAAAPSPAPSAS